VNADRLKGESGKFTPPCDRTRPPDCNPAINDVPVVLSTLIFTVPSTKYTLCPGLRLRKSADGQRQVFFPGRGPGGPQHHPFPAESARPSSGSLPRRILGPGRSWQTPRAVDRRFFQTARTALRLAACSL